MLTQREQIAEHRKQIPRQFRKVYDTAMSGRSLRAAVNSQCIECMGYVFKEVKLCCSPQCPLFPYRPLRGISYGVSGVGQNSVESTNSEHKEAVAERSGKPVLDYVLEYHNRGWSIIPIPYGTKKARMNLIEKTFEQESIPVVWQDESIEERKARSLQK